MRRTLVECPFGSNGASADASNGKRRSAVRARTFAQRVSVLCSVTPEIRGCRSKVRKSGRSADCPVWSDIARTPAELAALRDAEVASELVHRLQADLDGTEADGRVPLLDCRVELAQREDRLAVVLRVEQQCHAE